MLAKPEKALLDLLYLYPFYQTEVDFKALRLDEGLIQETVHPGLYMEYAVQFGNRALEKRAKLLLKSCNL